MTTTRHFSYAFLAAACATLTACGGGSSNTAASASALTIPFAARSGATEINCDAQLSGLGTTADSATISSFALYIHDIKLKTATGDVSVNLDANTFQDAENGVALLDFQDRNNFCNGTEKPTNKQLSATISSDVNAADITGIEFKVGLPAEVNHRDVATTSPPYNVQSLFWNWNSGYKFMRLDVSPAAGVNVTYGNNATAGTFNFHLGSTGCTGDAQIGEIVNCSNPNHVTVVLDGFSVNGNTSDSIVLDYEKLAEGVNLNLDNGVKVGCMSFPNDPECPTMFSNLGMNYGQNQATASQAVFSVEKQ